MSVPKNGQTIGRKQCEQKDRQTYITCKRKERKTHRKTDRRRREGIGQAGGLANKDNGRMIQRQTHKQTGM